MAAGLIPALPGSQAGSGSTELFGAEHGWMYRAWRSEVPAECSLKKELWSFSYEICRALVRCSVCRGCTGQRWTHASTGNGNCIPTERHHGG